MRHRCFSRSTGISKWYERRKGRLDPRRAVGLLLMRPQVVSGAHRHYDALIRALEGEGLPVVPVLSTLMDNRDACRAFLVEPGGETPRVGQILSLTGFSFVGGPAMNDSAAAVAYLKTLNRPLRSAVSLEMQRRRGLEREPDRAQSSSDRHAGGDPGNRRRHRTVRLRRNRARKRSARAAGGPVPANRGAPGAMGPPANDCPERTCGWR